MHLKILMCFVLLIYETIPPPKADFEDTHGSDQVNLLAVTEQLLVYITY